VLQDKFKQAVLAHQQGRLADAERIYGEVLQQQPNHFDALHLLGVIATQTGQTERAVELITKAIGMNAMVAVAHRNLGNAQLKLKRPADALPSYDRAIALTPNDAVLHNNRGLALQDLKRLGDALIGYQRAIKLKPDFAEAHYNCGNVLQELGRLEAALVSYDRAIALKPNDAEAYSNRGTILQRLNRHTEALASYDRAIALKPDDAEPYNNRGLALLDLRRLDEALANFDRAIALKPDFAAGYGNRGNALKHLGRPAEALASYDKAIALMPDLTAEVHCNRGNVQQELQRLNEALDSYDKAIALKPNFAEAHGNKSHCLLQMGRFEQGWRQYEWRKKLDHPIAARSYPRPLWLGEESIAGKTLFIWWEQGFGDTIQFCRYAKLVEARGAKVVMSVQQPLCELLKHISPTIDVIPPNDKPSYFDYHCPLMSLPLAFGTTLETIPAEQHYLKADEELRAAWAARLAAKTKPKVGVVWSGSKFHKIWNRSMPLEIFLPLIGTDADWVCLQKELDEQELAVLRQDGRVAFFGDDLRDFNETAALLSLMDLVITIDTAVAHLAGAMGKPVWILLPYASDWRWLLDRNNSPWYPSARLFRQPRIGDWTSIINQLKSALRSGV